LYVLDGDHTLKPFKGNGSLFWGLRQVLNIPNGEYLLSLKVFADLVKEYVNGQKVWADDPNGRDGLIKVYLNNEPADFQSLTPGEWNDVSLVLDITQGDMLHVDFMMPFPLINNGLFLDDWSLELIPENEPCGCNAITDVRTVSLWIPQYGQMSETEIEQCQTWARYGFPLSDGSHTTGEHMLCPSHVDALRIHTQGLPGSVLAVAYPAKIGSGVTLDWIQQNCPCALEDGRQVVFLGDESLRFTQSPVVTR
jgi:hypothetical protein